MKYELHSNMYVGMYIVYEHIIIKLIYRYITLTQNQI